MEYLTRQEVNEIIEEEIEKHESNADKAREKGKEVKKHAHVGAQWALETVKHKVNDRFTEKRRQAS